MKNRFASGGNTNYGGSKNHNIIVIEMATIMGPRIAKFREAPRRSLQIVCGFSLAFSLQVSAGVDIMAGPGKWRDWGLPDCNGDYDDATNMPCAQQGHEWSFWCYEHTKPWEYNHQGRYYGTDTGCQPDSSGFATYVSFPPKICPPGYSIAPYDKCTLDGTEPIIDKVDGPPLECAGNPIDIATGNKYQKEVDIVPDVSGIPAFSRHYNSLISRYSPKLVPLPAIDNHWRHTYERFIVLVERDLGSTAVAHRPEGQALYYVPSSQGWEGDPDVFDMLEEIKNTQGERIGWRYVLASGSVEEYHADGRLNAIERPSGERIVLTYTNDRLTEVDNGNGYVLTFSYNASGKLASVQDSSGVTVSYTYDETIHETDRLKVAAYSNGGSRTYHYEDLRISGSKLGYSPRHALTGITDERGIRYATWQYGWNGRAIVSEHSGGADRTTLSYNGDGSITVTNALGRQTNYTFEIIQGLKRVTNVEGYATASCSGSNRSYSYTPEGWLAEKVDWKGVKTTYRYDSEGREISRTEAVGSSEERIITTEWHSDSRLPAKITTPGAITEFTYDTNGQLVSKTTTDRAASP